MNIIVERLIKHIKSKPPTEWKDSQLEDFAFSIQAIYEYLDKGSEERKQLKDIYGRIVDKVNNNKKYNAIINPGYLIKFDK